MVLGREAKILVKVLFICLGNICRSPTGEGVFETLIKSEGLDDRISVDSAGTAAYHVGEPPDPRSQAAALRRGIDMSSQKARRVRADDFVEFDYLVAMDQDNRSNLLAICPPGLEHKIHLMLNFAEGMEEQSVPDPYFTGGNGFEVVLDLIENASQGLLGDIRNKHF